MYSTPDLLLPASWYPHDMQAELLAAGIKTPVHARGLAQALGFDVPSGVQVVNVPAFGGSSLRHVYTATGGNPLAQYPRDKLCIVMTPTIPNFSYSKTVHGVPIRVRDLVDEQQRQGMEEEDLDQVVDAECGHLPPGFRGNAAAAMASATAIAASSWMASSSPDALAK